MASSSIPTSTTLDGHHPRQKQIMEMNGLQRQILVVSLVRDFKLIHHEKKNVVSNVLFAL